MVFFNYSTMQMAAKIVYYGPGLCGKTTNLQFIFGHTAHESRGEMVSLETETDRTLFFDLLPIDVGSIAGFNTRIQLYTVPGQVFYNTTRKLVLKGVDGVVFVADSQRPMLQANLESLKNLEENLGEMGLSLDTLPIVLQYNKRDLPEVVPVDEMNRTMNPKSWLHFEASAVTGDGVFETLKGISKLTLVSLKKRLNKMGSDSSARVSATAAPASGMQASKPGVAMPSASAPSGARPAAPVASPPKAASAPGAAASGAKPTAASAASQSARAPQPLSPAAKKPGTIDVLAELERIRKQAISGTPTAGSGDARRAAPPASGSAAPIASRAATNGRGEIHRSVELTLKKNDFRRARRFLLNLRVEDADRQIVDAIRDLPIEIQDVGILEKIFLHLNVALKSKD